MNLLRKEDTTINYGMYVRKVVLLHRGFKKAAEGWRRRGCCLFHPSRRSGKIVLPLIDEVSLCGYERARKQANRGGMLYFFTRGEETRRRVLFRMEFRLKLLLGALRPRDSHRQEQNLGIHR